MEKENILKAYEIQNLESHLVKEFNLKKHIYFDASDIIKMIQGILSFDSGFKIDFEKFKHSKETLIHGFASRNWLGEIRMLKPHQDEFIYKITYSNDLFPKKNKYKKDNIENDFLYKLFGDTRTITQLSKNDFPEYVRNLKENAEVIFKSNHIIEPIYWYERYQKYIIEEKIICLSHKPFDIPSFKKSKIYREIYNLLETKRPEVHFKFNNLMDALAVAQLQSLVDEFNKHPFETQLPLFYVNTGKLMESLEEIHKRDESLLSYKYDNKYYRIFRCDLFFKIDKIFNLDDEEFKSIPITYLTDIKNKLSDIIIDYDENKKMNFEKNLVKLLDKNIAVEFFEKIWLKEKGYPEISKSIREFINYKEKYEEDVKKIVEEEKEKIKAEFNYEIRLSTILKKIVYDLSLFEKEAESILENYKGSIHPFQDFGLTRFSFSDDSCNKIKEICDNLFISNEADNEEQIKLKFSDGISFVVDYLINGITKKDRINDLTSGLAILWIFGKYETIAIICKYYDKYIISKSDYKISIYDLNSFYCIYSSSIILSSNYISKEDNMVIKKYLRIIRSNNYKYKISRSFVLYQLWDRSVNYVSIPEQATNSQKIRMQKFKKYHTDSLKYMKEALQYLTISDLEKKEHRRTKYYYCMNNYIYYCTKGGSKKEFNSRFIQAYFQELVDSKTSQGFWQYRFYDTIAWYNLRKSVISLNQKDFSDVEYHLKKAKENNKESLNGSKTKRERSHYLKLTEYIEQFEKELLKNKTPFLFGLTPDSNKKI